MNLLSTGDLARSYQLRRYVSDAKQDVKHRSTEVATGVTADPGQRLRGDFTPLAGIERSLAALESYDIAVKEADTFTTALQTALSQVQTIAEETGTALTLASGTGQTTRIEVLSAQARQGFDAAISALNTRVADRALLAGTATDRRATATADDMMTELSALTAGMTLADDIITAVTDWFNGTTTGYGASGYSGAADPPAPFRIEDGVEVAAGLTATAPELRDTLRGLALGALLTGGSLNLPADQAAGLARKAGEGLLAANTDLADLQARIGTVQNRIEEAATRNSAESDALETARLSMIAVDPYEAATAMKEAETRLETLYTLTARLSDLSLTEYLR